MAIGFQVEPKIADAPATLVIQDEASNSGAIVALDDDALGEVSGGAGLFRSSTSGFSESEFSAGSMTFATRDGAGSASFVHSKQTNSFAQDIMSAFK